MEQLARDARITTLYEGTTGVQALDLVGRKLLQLKGGGLRAFLAEAQAFCQSEASNPALSGLMPVLAEKLAEWEAVSRKIAGEALENAEEIGGAAYDYLFYSGYVALAYWWAKTVAAADRSSMPASFKAGKRETARFYFERILPRTLMHKAAIESGVDNLMTLDADAFG